MEGGNGASKGKATAAPTSGGGGASQYLANLPSRGLFSSTVLSSNPGGMRVYICEHDTSPPADQLIKTNQTNILIRSLTLKKQKNDCNSKETKVKATTNARGKRSAERTGDGSSAKKANIAPTHSSVRQEGSSSRSSVDLQGLTVERLRILLKERGLSTKGKKDELIGRLKNDRELIARTRNDQEDDGDCSL